MAGWSVLLAAADGTKYGTMIHREYFTLIRVLRPMAQLYFYYSAMNAGKSTALLQSSYNYQERGMRTVVYTAEIDDRFGAGKVSSRIGLHRLQGCLTLKRTCWRTFVSSMPLSLSIACW